MATLYECDKCHSLSSNSNDMHKLTVPHFLPGGGITNKSMDMCNFCLKKLQEFLQPQVREKAATERV